MADKKTISNRRAGYDYDLGQKVVAGIALKGFEVAAVRRQRVSLKGAFVDVKDGQVWLRNLEVFNPGNQANATATAHRLLLTKPQIRKLKASLEAKNNTIVPTRLILDKHIKVELAPAKGRRRHDKREAIKKRESDRRIRRTLQSSKGGT